MEDPDGLPLTIPEYGLQRLQNNLPKYDPWVHHQHNEVNNLPVFQLDVLLEIEPR